MGGHCGQRPCLLQPMPNGPVRRGAFIPPEPWLCPALALKATPTPPHPTPPTNKPLCPHTHAPSATHTVGFSGSNPAASRASAQEGSLRSAATAAQEPQRSGKRVLSMLQARKEGRRQGQAGGVDVGGGRVQSRCTGGEPRPRAGRPMPARLAQRAPTCRPGCACPGCPRPAGAAPAPEVAGQAGGGAGAGGRAGLAVLAQRRRHLGCQLAKQPPLGLHNIPLVHLKPPQVWKWGTRGRAEEGWAGRAWEGGGRGEALGVQEAGTCAPGFHASWDSNPWDAGRQAPGKGVTSRRHGHRQKAAS